MKTQINEIKRMQQLAGIISEAVEVPSWLASKLEDVHTKPGQGSIFAKSINDVLKLAQDALDKEQNIDKIANSTGTLTIKSPGIGYNLVLPIDKAKALPGAKESEVEKVEGPNRIKVPAITTTAPMDQFKTDELTVIVRPKKDESGAVIPNEYIVLSAFPGDPSIPRASEWSGKYAVVIPGGKEEMSEGQLYHRGSEGTQTLIIPNDLGEVDVDDFTTALEFAIDGEMSERDYELNTEYNLNVVDQNGDDPTKVVYFKFKQKGEDLEVDPASIRVEMDEVDRLDELVDIVLTKMRKQLNENLTQDSFEQMIDKFIETTIEDLFFGSGPSDEDEENQLRNAVAAKAQEELETQYPGIEVNVLPTNKGDNYYTVENEEKNIPYFSYVVSY
jgi:hypothetical protein